MTLGRRHVGGEQSHLGECPGTWQIVRVARVGRGWLPGEVGEEGGSPSLRVVDEKDVLT